MAFNGTRSDVGNLKLSVAICTYNGGSFLREQLSSIATQSRLPDEVIVCDDGSADETLEILKFFSGLVTFPVRVERNSSRLGSTANFAKAISLCTGHIIVLADQDDVWDAEKLDCIESTFSSQSQLGGLLSDGELIDQNGRLLGKTLWDSIGFSTSRQSSVRAGHGFDQLFPGNFTTGAALAFRAEWRDLILPIPEGWVHDYWIAVLLSGVSTIQITGRKLIRYRCHEAQQLGVRREQGMLKTLLKYSEFDTAAYLSESRNWEAICRRLNQFDFASRDEVLRKCEMKISHLRSRASQPPGRLRRIPIVLKEVLNLNYFRYSSGLKSIARDALARSRRN